MKTANGSVDVDLNPIRAGIAETVETSAFTSANDPGIVRVVCQVPSERQGANRR